jgi:hypothetical protein
MNKFNADIILFGYCCGPSIMINKSADAQCIYILGIDGVIALKMDN